MKAVRELVPTVRETVGPIAAGRKVLGEAFSMYGGWEGTHLWRDSCDRSRTMGKLRAGM